MAIKHTTKGAQFIARTAGVTKGPHPRKRRPMSELPRDLYQGVSEKFHAECAKGVDPFEAAEKIGCEVRVDSDGALEVLY